MATKSPICVAVGSAIREARRSRGFHSAEAFADEVRLSASYFRSVEAGSVLPPPSIAAPLAVRLGWSFSRTAELLAAIAEMDAKERNSEGLAISQQRISRARDLIANGICRQVLDPYVNGFPLEGVVLRYVTEVGAEADARPEWVRGVPWTIDFGMRKMAKQVSKAYSVVDKQYIKDFEREFSSEILEVCAVVSYDLTPEVLRSSGFNLEFMNNNSRPIFSVYSNMSEFTDTERLKGALLREISKITKSNVSESRLIVGRNDLGILYFDKNGSCVTSEQQNHSGRFPFENAWLYRLKEYGPEEWVGFLDSYSLANPENFDAVALSVVGATNLHSQIAGAAG